MDVYDELIRLRKLGQKSALATIVQVQGSIPSHQSAKLLVREDGSFVGTIGGGCVEAEVWNAAREVIETGKPRHLTFQLGQDAAYDTGLICGGQLDVFVEAVIPLPSVYIFGGGHISKSLSKVLTMAGFETAIIDDRENFANRERFPEAAEVIAGEYEEVCDTLPVTEGSYIVIVTRGHRDDMRVLRWASGTPARYVAMIGSKRKVIGVARELEREGVPAAQLERIFAPMGLEIGAISPEEIAISVAAEMIAVRRDPGCSRVAKALEIVVSGRASPHFALVTPAIILAAGASTRMKFPKANLPFQEGTFLTSLAARLAVHCQPVIVVLGADAEYVKQPASAQCVMNPHWREGQLSSLQCGLRALPPNTSSALFTLVDHPRPACSTIARLLHSRRPLAIPVFEEKRGHPVFLRRGVIDALLALHASESAKTVLRDFAAETDYITVDDPGILDDVDDAAALARFRERTKST